MDRQIPPKVRAMAYKDQVREDTYRELTGRFGGPYELAKVFDTSFQAIYLWKGRVPWARMDQAVEALQRKK